jgi:hypothetical protein
MMSKWRVHFHDEIRQIIANHDVTAGSAFLAESDFVSSECGSWLRYLELIYETLMQPNIPFAHGLLVLSFACKVE